MAILDSISSGTTLGAWSIARKLSSGYSGYAIKVSRAPYASPADELDIGFDAEGNTDKAAAVAWGTNLRVIKVYDQSGNGVDLSPTAPDFGTLNTHGSRLTLEFGETPLNSIKYSSTATVDLTAPKEFLVIDYHHINSSYLTDFGAGNVFASLIPSSALFSQYNGMLVSYGSIVFDGPTQCTSWFTAGDDAFRMNGDDLPVVSGTNAGDTAAPGVVVHLGNIATGGDGLTGEYYERILIDGAVTDGDRDIIEADQVDYYLNNNRLIGFGDSLTYGTGLADYHLAYAQQLELLLADGWDSYNRGQAGKRLDELEALVPSILVPQIRTDATENVVALNGGFNDAYQGASAATIQSRFTSLCNTVKAISGLSFLVVRPLPPANVVGQPPTYATVRDAVNAWLATQEGTLFDLYADSTENPYIGSDANTANTTYFLADQVHRTVEGYATEAPYGRFNAFITTDTLPNGQVGDAPVQTIETTNGLGAPTFAVTAGNLPAGRFLNATTGEITGTYSLGGAFPFTISVTDAAGTDSQSYVVAIAGTGVQPQVAFVVTESEQVTGWHYGGTVGYVRVYASASFYAAGQFFAQGNPQNIQSFCQEYTASVSGTTFTIPPLTLPVTTTSNIPNVTLTIVLYSSDNVSRLVKLSNGFIDPAYFQSPAQSSVLVSNGGTSLANGVYTYTGLSSGLPYYNLLDSGLTDDTHAAISSDTDIYTIYASDGTALYSADSPSVVAPWLSPNYSIVDGDSPAPVVTEYTQFVTATLEQIILSNQGFGIIPNPTYPGPFWNVAQTKEYVNTLVGDGTTPFASSTVAGKTTLDVAPVNALVPIAVGTNSPILSDITADITDLENTKAPKANPTFTGTVTVATITASGNITGANLSGTNTGDVTKSGENYLSLAGQVITANAVNLSGTNVTGTLAAARMPALTGDVTTSAGSVATTIANSAVTNAKVATGIDAVKIGGGAVSNTEFGYLDGVTSAIQTQLNAKAPLASPTFTGTVTIPTLASTTSGLGTATGTSLAVTGVLSSSSASAGIGYATGSGATVSQGTSRTTAVTINAINGEIELFSAAGSATPASFTVNNTSVGATDSIILNQSFGTDMYACYVNNIALHSFLITVVDLTGTTSESPKLRFSVIKGVNA